MCVYGLFAHEQASAGHGIGHLLPCLLLSQRLDPFLSLPFLLVVRLGWLVECSLLVVSLFLGFVLSKQQLLLLQQHVYMLFLLRLISQLLYGARYLLHLLGVWQIAIFDEQLEDVLLPRDLEIQFDHLLLDLVR